MEILLRLTENPDWANERNSRVSASASRDRYVVRRALAAVHNKQFGEQATSNGPESDCQF